MLPTEMKAAPDEVLKINSCGCAGYFRLHFLSYLIALKLIS